MINNQNVPKLRFKEFSGEWEIVELRTLYPQIRNGFVGTATPHYRDNGIQYLQGKNVKDGKIDVSGMIYISEEFHQKNIKSQLKQNDIVMVQSGHVGECAVITDEYAFSNCHALIVLTPQADVASAFYVNYFYSDIGKKLIYKIKTGNTIEHILASELKTLEVTKTEFIEQQKIAVFLSAVDSKIDQLTRKKELLEQYKKGAMQNIFSQELRFKADDGSEFPDWEEKNGGKLFESISNKNHNSDLPILAISQEHGAIPRELINYQISVTDKSVDSYKIVDVGDFIISLRSFQGGIEYSNYKGICSPAYIILRNSAPINNLFYKSYFKTEYYIQRLCEKLEGIRDGKMISYKYFSEIELPYPSLSEQTKIANFLSAIDTKIDLATKQLEEVKKFKKGLLQQMFV